MTVLHAVADHIVDSYLEVTEAIEDDIDEMEREVFTPRSTMDAEQIYVMKREVLELRRAVVPLGAPLRKLTEGYSSLVPHEVRSYFRQGDSVFFTFLFPVLMLIAHPDGYSFLSAEYSAEALPAQTLERPLG